MVNALDLKSKKLRIFKGRSSKGIKGIELSPNDEIVSLSITNKEKIKKDTKSDEKICFINYRKWIRQKNFKQ